MPVSNGGQTVVYLKCTRDADVLLGHPLNAHVGADHQQTEVGHQTCPATRAVATNASNSGTDNVIWTHAHVGDSFHVIYRPVSRHGWFCGDKHKVTHPPYGENMRLDVLPVNILECEGHTRLSVCDGTCTCDSSRATSVAIDSLSYNCGMYRVKNQV